jgi:hypothetical protein
MKGICVISIAFVTLPAVMYKSLGELKILSYLIAISVLLLLTLSGTTLYLKENKFAIP